MNAIDIPIIGLCLFLAAGVLCIICSAIREQMDRMYNNRVGINNANKWAVMIEELTLGKEGKKRLYHTETHLPANNVKYTLQLNACDATTFTDQAKARQVCENYANNKNDCLTKQINVPKNHIRIYLLERRSYFGIKLWYDLHIGEPI